MEPVRHSGQQPERIKVGIPALSNLEITVQKVESVNPFKAIWNWLFDGEKNIERKVIPITTTTKNNYVVEIEELAKQLGIASSTLSPKDRMDDLVDLVKATKALGFNQNEVFQYKEKRGLTPQQTIKKLPAIKKDAKALGIPLSELLAAYGSDASLNSNKLEREAKALDIPLTWLVAAYATYTPKQLEQYKTQAKDVKQKWQSAHARLDQLYKKGLLETTIKEKDVSADQVKMTQAQLQELKQIVRTATICLNPIGHPKSEKHWHKERSQVSIPEIGMPTGFTISGEKGTAHIQIEKKAGDIAFTTLFGQVLGVGGYGVAIHRVDLETGELMQHEDSVMKLTRTQGRDMLDQVMGEEALQYEYELLQQLHGNQTQVLGIQKPVRILEISILSDPNGVEMRSCILGPAYQADLYEFLDKSPPENLSLNDKLSIAYQLFHGVAYLHQQHLFHGDIKLENVFYNQQDPDQSIQGPRVYLADFGGSVDVNTEFRKCIVTDVMNNVSDLRELKKMVRAKKYDWSRLQAMDVFTVSSTICSLLLGLEVYMGCPSEFALEPLKQREMLISLKNLVGLDAAKMLMRSLSSNSENRPTAEELLTMITGVLKQRDPERLKALQSLSVLKTKPKSSA